MFTLKSILSSSSTSFVISSAVILANAATISAADFFTGFPMLIFLSGNTLLHYAIDIVNPSIFFSSSSQILLLSLNTLNCYSLSNPSPSATPPSLSSALSNLCSSRCSDLVVSILYGSFTPKLVISPINTPIIEVVRSG
jgi:hypothetical protein